MASSGSEKIRRPHFLDWRDTAECESSKTQFPSHKDRVRFRGRNDCVENKGSDVDGPGPRRANQLLSSQPCTSPSQRGLSTKTLQRATQIQNVCPYSLYTYTPTALESQRAASMPKSASGAQSPSSTPHQRSLANHQSHYAPSPCTLALS